MFKKTSVLSLLTIASTLFSIDLLAYGDEDPGFHQLGLYGDCPNGHAYGPDGGCYGYECPHN